MGYIVVGEYRFAQLRRFGGWLLHTSKFSMFSPQWRFRYLRNRSSAIELVGQAAFSKL